MSDTEIEESDQEWLNRFASVCKYMGAKILPDGQHYAAVSPMAFTSAIIVGEVGNEGYYLDRWCYKNPVAALLALNVWDGQGEPVGWHRHPASGRRVSESPFEVDENGKRVGEVGVMYVRP